MNPTRRTVDFALFLALTGLLTDPGHSTVTTKDTVFGINCFDLFYALLFPQVKNKDPLTRLRKLSSIKVPYVRFCASGFWPNEWKLYLSNEADYWRRMDRVFSAAEKTGIKLIPSLFFNASTISDIVDEPVSHWGKQDSKTRRFSEEYAKKYILRYKNSKVVLMWEFSNEFNTFVDMPNALNWWPKVSPSTGTPRTRSQQDMLNRAAVRDAYIGFANLVKELDPGVLISSGGDFPQFNAHNLSKKRFDVDTREAFGENLSFINPPPLSTISVHLYPDRKRRAFGGVKAYANLLDPIVATAHKNEQKVFVGEFGVAGSSSSSQLEFWDLVAAIKNAGVEFAALWNYDNAAQVEWNVDFDNERSYQLEIFGKNNGRLVG